MAHNIPPIKLLGDTSPPSPVADAPVLTYSQYATVSSRLTQRFTGVRIFRHQVASKFPKVSEIVRVQMSHLRQIASFATAFCKFLNKPSIIMRRPEKEAGYVVNSLPYVMIVSQQWSGFRMCCAWILVTARSERQWTAEGSVFGAVSLCVFVYEISRGPLNGFAPHSHRRRVLSLAGTSLKVKVSGQGHQTQKNDIFRPFRRPACDLCMVKNIFSL